MDEGLHLDAEDPGAIPSSAAVAAPLQGRGLTSTKHIQHGEDLSLPGSLRVKASRNPEHTPNSGI